MEHLVYITILRLLRLNSFSNNRECNNQQYSFTFNGKTVPKLNNNL